MSGLLGLAWASLRNRKATVLLTVLTLGLSVMLLLGIERVRQEVNERRLKLVVTNGDVLAACTGLCLRTGQILKRLAT